MTPLFLLNVRLFINHALKSIFADWCRISWRDKMDVTENGQFSRGYHDPEKRSIANNLNLVFKGGLESDSVTVECGNFNSLRELYYIVKEF
ncbi:hypothetical protein EP47_12315 [Legionella norrlandica]|uniref:Uncharacterized protein n=1 Tax=Legionella norrlandica TaxID=1498499 RepID=A0A0A2SWK3_9GAMM|nr:hypothetical protein [Legionella norrlandica]KGP63809.1 hypothetical protein EP47_12315 [Legionella norrlandica]